MKDLKKKCIKILNCKPEGKKSLEKCMLDGIILKRVLQAKKVGKGRNSEYYGGPHERSNN